MKDKMFILTTIPSSLNFFREQISILREIYNITLVSSDLPGLELISKREGVLFKAIGIKREISLFNDLKSLFKLYVFFRKEKPAIVHCNTPKASLLGLLAARLNFVPTRVYYIHGFKFHGVTGIKRKLLIIMEKIACMCATHIIAVSEGVQKIANAELTNKKVDIIHYGSPNGVFIKEYLDYSFDKHLIKQELEFNEQDFVYGFVGRLVGDKGVNELVTAFKHISFNNKNIKLLLVGKFESDLDPLLDATIKEINSNPNINYVGYQRDVKKYLSAMDVFVSPSYREGFGLSVLEASMMKLPVIVSNVTGYSEIVIENVTGFFVNPRDVNGLQQIMYNVYKDRSKLYLTGIKGRQLVMEKYDHQDVVDSAVKYYSKLQSNV